MASDETALMPIHHLPSDELDNDKITAFLSLGFTHHREILNKCKEFDERWYYILASSKGTWTVEQLQQHLRADDYHHIGALPNNFEKTLSPMAQATRAVRSFRDEYLLELVNLDNVDARVDQDVDERVLSKTLAPVIEGVRRVMANARVESDSKPKKKSAPRRTSKGDK